MQPVFLSQPSNPSSQGNNFMNFPNGVSNQQGPGGDQLSNQFENIDLNSPNYSSSNLGPPTSINSPPFDPIKYQNSATSNLSGQNFNQFPPPTSNNIMSNTITNVPFKQYSPQQQQQQNTGNISQNSSRPPSALQSNLSFGGINNPPTSNYANTSLPPTSNYGNTSLPPTSNYGNTHFPSAENIAPPTSNFGNTNFPPTSNYGNTSLSTGGNAAPPTSNFGNTSLPPTSNYGNTNLPSAGNIAPPTSNYGNAGFSTSGNTAPPTSNYGNTNLPPAENTAPPTSNYGNTTPSPIKNTAPSSTGNTKVPSIGPPEPLPLGLLNKYSTGNTQQQNYKPTQSNVGNYQQNELKQSPVTTPFQQTPPKQQNEQQKEFNTNQTQNNTFPTNSQTSPIYLSSNVGNTETSKPFSDQFDGLQQSPESKLGELNINQTGFKPSTGGSFQPVKPTNENFSPSFVKSPAPLNQPYFPIVVSTQNQIPPKSNDPFVSQSENSFSPSNQNSARNPSQTGQGQSNPPGNTGSELSIGSQVPPPSSQINNLGDTSITCHLSGNSFSSSDQNQIPPQNTSLPLSGNTSGPTQDINQTRPPSTFSSSQYSPFSPSGPQGPNLSSPSSTKISSFPGQQPPPLGQRPPIPGQQPPMPGQQPPLPGQQSSLPGQQGFFPGAPPSQGVPLYSDMNRPTSGFGGSNLSSLPPKNTLNGPPPMSTLNGPPSMSAHNGPPSMSAHNGPPSNSSLNGPPPISTLSGPPSMSAHNGPPSMSAYYGPPSMSAHNGPPSNSSLNGPPPISTHNGPPPIFAHNGPPAMSNGPPSLSGPSQYSSPQGISGRPSYPSQKYPQPQYGPTPQQQQPPYPNNQQPGRYPRPGSQSQQFLNNQLPPQQQNQYQTNPTQTQQPPVFQSGGFPPQQQGFQPGQPPAMGGYPDAQMQYSNTRPQPPQAAMKLHPDKMPSRIQVINDDRTARSGVFKTDQRGGMPPLVTTPFTVQDYGNCSPRFVRSTMYSVPATNDLMKQVGVPFGIVISPFAKVSEGEQDPPCIDYSNTDGPVRCVRCKAYMSPFMQFIDGGRRFQCSFCKITNDCPEYYFHHLDHTGQRSDKYHRPELFLGSYEFLVPKPYCRESIFPSQAPAIIFLLDISYNNINSGLVSFLCSNIISLLNEMTNDKMKVGFITYGNSVHFYNLNKNLVQPEMLEVTDLNEMFMPLLNNFLVLPKQGIHIIETIMKQIPILFNNNKQTEIILYPAIQAGMEALKINNTVGKLLIFHSSLPIYEAPGKLSNRDDRKMLGTEKEKSVLAPQNTMYNNLAQECVTNGVCVDLYIFNNSYIDLATIGQVSRLTGGEIFKYTYFQPHIDGERLLNDIRRNITRPTAYDAVVRVRTSTGVRPTDFYGHFFMSNTTDMDIPAIDCDKSIAIEIKHDDKLNPEEGVLIQVALLYTSSEGLRKVRIHNLSLNSTTQMQDIYRYCELDTLINYFSKQCVFKLLEHAPKAVKDALITRTVTILATYRKHCSTPGSSSGQLILPECLKLLPLYINSLIKCDAISGGPEIAIDDRSFAMYCTQIMDVPTSVIYFYPHLISLHDVDPNADDLPSQERCLFEKFKSEGVYLLDNSIYMFLWVGLNVDPNWLEQVFGVSNINQLDVDKISCHLPELNNPLSRRIHDIIDYIRSIRPRSMRLTVVRQKDKLEMVLRQFLIEDRGYSDNQLCYVKFLCHLHSEIRAQLS